MFQQISRITSRRLTELYIQQLRLTNHPRICRRMATQAIYDAGAAEVNILMKGNIPKPETASLNSDEFAILDTGSKNFEKVDAFSDREFNEHTVDQFEELYKDDTTGETKKLVELILQEYEFTKYNSMGRVPSSLDVPTMDRMIKECRSTPARSSFFNYLFKKEMASLASDRRSKRIKDAKSLSRVEKYAKMNSEVHQRTGLLDRGGQLIYGLWHNSQLIRLPESKMKHGASYSRLRDAALFGPKLIFDFDFDDYMNRWYCRNMADQVMEAYGLNRYHYYDAFDVWFCNFRPEDPTAAAVMRRFENSKDHMITTKPDCFTNHFDKSRLVYLSPNAPDNLRSVGRNDDIFIIGCYNDRGAAKPVSYRKAEQLGIRSAKIPIDRSVYWKGPSKSLCINHVTGIMLEALANGSNWTKAILKHTPTRKIKSKEVVMEEEERRQARLTARMSKSNPRKINLRIDMFD